MHTVRLKAGKADNMLLQQHDLDLHFIQYMLSVTVNTLRPTKRKFLHSLKIAFVDEEFSMYTFGRHLHITKTLLKERARYKLLDGVFNHIMHEFAHYIQFNIDKVNFSKFAVDHEKISNTKYLNNITERQARVYGNIASKFTQLYIKLNKVKTHTKPLNNAHGTG